MTRSPEPVLALSLFQPWATLIAIGGKQYETRSWSTPYRGRLAIHAGRTFGWEGAKLMTVEPFRSVLHAAGIHIPSQLPRGFILATCRLVDCVRTEDIAGGLSDQEWAFGDYTPGRFAFNLDDVQALAVPIPARGYQKLWDCTALLEGP
jgi:hypothetical protein